MPSVGKYFLYIKLSQWAPQPFPCSSKVTKTLESVARPHKQKNSNEKDDICLLIFHNIYSVPPYNHTDTFFQFDIDFNTDQVMKSKGQNVYFFNVF